MTLARVRVAPDLWAYRLRDNGGTRPPRQENDPMQLIDARQIHELLAFDGLIDALRRAHLGGMPKHGSRFAFEEANAEAQPDRFIIIPAWQPGEGILAKFTTSFPLNKAAARRADGELGLRLHRRRDRRDPRRHGWRGDDLSQDRRRFRARHEPACAPDAETMLMAGQGSRPLS